MDHLNKPEEEISESNYLNRRDILRGLGYGAAGLTALSVPGFLRGMNGSLLLDDEAVGLSVPALWSFWMSDAILET